jgi:glycosyltransferase involved in cell wall biosynthesis
MLTTLKTVARALMGPTQTKLPVVCIFGHKPVTLTTPTADDYEEKRLDCRCYATDTDLERVLIRDRPDVIMTSGHRSAFPNLARAPFEVQKRWRHYDVFPSSPQLGVEAFFCYLTNLLGAPGGDELPLVTVCTPTYRTGDRIQRPLRSLREQTYPNWEWIVVDDSDDGGQTFAMLTRLAKTDHRIQIFKAGEHSGIIGRVKHWACRLGNGPILVELDHDDALTDDALALVVRGFQQFPAAGFLYTDCAEIAEDGTNVTYRDGWAFGYGAYTDVEYRGRVYKSGSGGNINAKTIRHIGSAPNHLRAWRRACYEALGGHNTHLHVADDYELLVRTFLATRMVRVPKLGYIQYRRSCTAQHVRNGDIYRHVRAIREYYDKQIHERLLSLGCEDFSWDDARGCSDYLRPNPSIESHATLIALV